MHTSSLFRGFALAFAMCLLSSLAEAASTCDVNGDGVVDMTDINLITAALNKPSSGLGDPRDANGDGVINALDARLCTVKCTNARCALGQAPILPSAIIGPTGGAVGLPDGARVDIPSGALVAPTLISISVVSPDASALPPGAVFAGKVYELTPSGLAFAEPVSLTIPFDPALLPGGMNTDHVLVYTREGGRPFDVATSDTGDEDQESHGQSVDPVARKISLNRLGFSQYVVIAEIAAALFKPATLTSGAAQIDVIRPGGSMRTTQGCPPKGLGAREGAIKGIVVHSTNNGTENNSFNAELLYATSPCNRKFAHYYIDRDGKIYQVVDDSLAAQHVRDGVRFTNATAIGIELFNNVGEPYDGRQIGALIRLVDYLLLANALPRPTRDPSTGRVLRDELSDTVVTHSENNPLWWVHPKCPSDAERCDPVGSFQSSATRTEIVKRLVNNEKEKVLITVPLAGGSDEAPALIDILVDSLAMLDRSAVSPGQHTGVVNASGGTGAHEGAPGNGGEVTFIENEAAFGQLLAATSPTQNRPLIVARGATVDAVPNGPISDAIIAGTLRLAAPLSLGSYGTFYVAPGGKIVVKNGVNGGETTLSVRGAPILQGLLESTGSDSDGAIAAGRGGNVTIKSAKAGILLVPTIVTRGGDSGSASNPGAAGGNVSLIAESSPLFIGGGGAGTGQAGEIAPFMRESAENNNHRPPSFIGASLPPPAPFNVGSGNVYPVAGQRVPLLRLPQQIGFTRGLLTSGGSGGFGGPPAGSAGGPGGSISISTNGWLTFRDVDLITGADVESLSAKIFLKDGVQRIYCAPTGSLGGKGTGVGAAAGSHGGVGGRAGDIKLEGTATLVPAVLTKSNIADIPGYKSRLTDLSDSVVNCSAPLDSILGQVRQISASGGKLYRLRLDTAGTGTAGGSGGIPGGSINGSSGRFGAVGASGSITGLPK